MFLNNENHFTCLLHQQEQHLIYLIILRNVSYFLPTELRKELKSLLLEISAVKLFKE